MVTRGSSEGDQRGGEGRVGVGARRDVDVVDMDGKEEEREEGEER